MKKRISMNWELIIVPLFHLSNFSIWGIDKMVRARRQTDFPFVFGTQSYYKVQIVQIVNGMCL